MNADISPNSRCKKYEKKELQLISLSLLLLITANNKNPRVND